MKVHRLSLNGRTVEAFYDRYERVWTAYCVDADGNQSSPAVYAMSKAEAVLLASIDGSDLYQPNPFYPSSPEA